MDKIKLALMALGVIFAAVLLYFVVGFVMSYFFYLVAFAALALIGYGAYKVLQKPKRTELPTTPGEIFIDAPKAERGLPDAQQILNQYRRELTEKKD